MPLVVRGCFTHPRTLELLGKHPAGLEQPVQSHLDGYASRSEEVLSVPLQGALRARATQDQIRRVHLRSDNCNLFASIFSSLTPDDGAREKYIESTILWTTKTVPEFSSFFTRSRLPNLRFLHIIGTLQNPLLDHLASQTTRLEVLSLRLTEQSPPPTTPQLLSILVSNPNLRELELSDAALPKEPEESGIQISLRNLRTVTLAGKSGRISRAVTVFGTPNDVGFHKPQRGRVLGGGRDFPNSRTVHAGPLPA